MYRPQDPPHRYSNKTLIGNWLEERALEKAQYDQAAFGKYSLDIQGTRRFENQAQNRQTNALMRAPLSMLPCDRPVLSGMKLMLCNKTLNVVLALNVQDKRKTRFGVFGVAGTSPIRRNVFQIQKVDLKRDDIIRFGDQVRIMTSPSLFGGFQLSMASTMMQFNQPMNPTTFQELFFSTTDNFDAVWQVEHPDFEKRFKGTAEELMAGTPFLLKHCATGKLMAVGSQGERNEFGTELQVFVETMDLKNKSQNLLKEMVGLKGADIVNKTFKAENLWEFRGAVSESEAFNDTQTDAWVKGATILEEVVDRIMKRGVFTLVELKNAVQNIDKKRTGMMHQEDLYWTLGNCGVSVSQAEFQILLGFFETNGTEVCYLPFFERFGEFLTPKKLEMIPLSIQYIQKRFPQLRLENLIRLFNVVGLEKEDVSRFVASWGDKKVTDFVTAEELRTYFEQICACVKTEEEFCAFLKRFTC